MSLSDPEALSRERDRKIAKEVTLAYIVEMCQDCAKVCYDKTLRFVTDSSTPPKGWEAEYAAYAEERRVDEFNKCVSVCELVRDVCPTPEVAALYEEKVREMHMKGANVGASAAAAAKQQQQQQEGVGSGGSGGNGSSSSPSSWFSKKKKEGGNESNSAGSPPPPPPPPTLLELDKPIDERLPPVAQMRRCEHVVERWTQHLFNMANKPSKILFNQREPKTTEEYDPITQRKKGPSSSGAGEPHPDLTNLVLRNAGASTSSGMPAAHRSLGEGGVEGEESGAGGARKTQRWAMMLRAKHESAGGVRSARNSYVPDDGNHPEHEQQRQQQAAFASNPLGSTAGPFSPVGDDRGLFTGAIAPKTAPTESERHAEYRKVAAAQDAASMLAGDGVRAILEDDAVAGDGQQRPTGTVPRW